MCIRYSAAKRSAISERSSSSAPKRLLNAAICCRMSSKAVMDRALLLLAASWGRMEAIHQRNRTTPVRRKRKIESGERRWRGVAVLLRSGAECEICVRRNYVRSRTTNNRLRDFRGTNGTFAAPERSQVPMTECVDAANRGN